MALDVSRPTELPTWVNAGRVAHPRIGWLQLRVLAAVCAGDQPTGRDLMAATGFSQQQVARLLRHLRDAKLVHIRVDRGDERRHRARPTARGRDLNDRILNLTEENQP